jgi:hypothetical protein
VFLIVPEGTTDKAAAWQAGQLLLLLPHLQLLDLVCCAALCPDGLLLLVCDGVDLLLQLLQRRVRRRELLLGLHQARLRENRNTDSKTAAWQHDAT